MKIFWKVIVAVIAFSLLGIMIVLGTAYIKSVERHTYLADNKVLSDKYVYEEFSNGKKRVKNRATQQVILDRLEGLGVFGRIGGCDVGREDRFYRPARTDGYPADLELSGR